jgi:hypothetical protein
MIYFKYHTSFKKVSSLSNLTEKQKIERINEEKTFNSLFSKGETLYCFINPFLSEIQGETVLDWGLSEGEAWDKIYESQAEI